MNISESIRLCMRKAKSTRAEETARAYQNALNLFLVYLGEDEIETSSPLTSISVEHFIDFAEWIAGSGYSKSTMQVYSSGVKFYFRYLVLKGILEPSYYQIIRYEDSWRDITRKREDKLPRFPRPDDVDKMLESARLLKQYDSPIYERNVAIVEFLASTGCRNQEICDLLVKDFAEDYRSAIVTGKGKKERRVFISRSGSEALMHYWAIRKYRGKEDPAFTRHDRGASGKILPLTTVSIRNIVKKISMVAGVELFSPHYFRHAFAIRVLHETGNLALTQDLLGHASPDSTRVYAKIYPEEIQSAHREIFG